MNKIFFLSSIILLSGFAVSDALAETIRGYDWQETRNFDGSLTRTIGLTPYIQDSTGSFVPQIVTEQTDHIKIESSLISFIYDKNTCGISIYEPERIGVPIYDELGQVIATKNNSPVLTSESWTVKEALNGTDIWNESSFNNVSCTSNLIQNSTGTFIESLKSDPSGHVKITYAKPFDKPLETFTEIFNKNPTKTNHKFGSDQSIIKSNGVTHEFNQEDNYIIYTTPKGNKIKQDYSKAVNEFWTINENGVNIHLDFKKIDSILPVGSKKILDPTFGKITPTAGYVESGLAAGASCPSYSSGAGGLFVHKHNTAASGYCTVLYTNFDVTDIPDTAEITAATFEFDLDTDSGADQNCVLRDLDTLPSNSATTYNEGLTGTKISAAFAECGTIGNDHTVTINAAGLTAFQNNLSSDWIGFSVFYDSTTRDGSAYGLKVLSDLELSITYNLPPDPPMMLNGTFNDSPPFNLDLQWSVPENNGYAIQNYTIYNQTNTGGWNFVDNTTNTNYNIQYDQLNQTIPIRVIASNELGRSGYNYPIHIDLADNLMSHWHFDYTLTDIGNLTNDGTVTGNELYQNNTGRTGIDLDGSSYVSIPKEWQYDFDITDPFSFTFWVKKDVSGNPHLINKRLNGGSTEGYNLITNDKIRMHYVGTGGSLVIDETTTDFNDGIWRHVAVTKGSTASASDVSIYINGVLGTLSIADDTLAGSMLHNQELRVGTNRQANSFYDGQVSDFMIFDKELTANEVLHLYQQTMNNTLAVKPPAITSLTATTTDLSSVQLDWTQPDLNSVYGKTISGYYINFTTPFGNPLTVITNNTLSSATSYEVTDLTIGSNNSFRVSPVTSFGSNETGNIANTTSFSLFTIGSLSIPTEANTNILDVLFTETNFNNTTIDLDVRYPNTVTDFRCNFDYENAQINKNYTGFASTAYDTTYDNSTFRFVNATNEIIDAYCWDESNPSVNGTYKIIQSTFPFIDNIKLFQSGAFGTDGSFGAMDLITLIVIILSMVGFNKENPAAGILIAMMILGGTAYFEIITLETTLFGALALIVMIAIVVTRKN